MRTTASSAAELIEAALPFAGLSCAAEAVGLEHQLRQIDGVVRATVNPITETVYVCLDPARATAENVRLALERLGYRCPLPT